MICRHIYGNKEFKGIWPKLPPFFIACGALGSVLWGKVLTVIQLVFGLVCIAARKNVVDLSE